MAAQPSPDAIQESESESEHETENVLPDVPSPVVADSTPDPTRWGVEYAIANRSTHSKRMRSPSPAPEEAPQSGPSKRSRAVSKSTSPIWDPGPVIDRMPRSLGQVGMEQPIRLPRMNHAIHHDQAPADNEGPSGGDQFSDDNDFVRDEDPSDAEDESRHSSGGESDELEPAEPPHLAGCLKCQERGPTSPIGHTCSTAREIRRCMAAAMSVEPERDKKGRLKIFGLVPYRWSRDYYKSKGPAAKARALESAQLHLFLTTMRRMHTIGCVHPYVSADKRMLPRHFKGIAVCVAEPPNSAGDLKNLLILAGA
jgi:hypothetical protein